MSVCVLSVNILEKKERKREEELRQKPERLGTGQPYTVGGDGSYLRASNR